MTSNWDRIVHARLAKLLGEAQLRRIFFFDRLTRDAFRALNLACDATLAPFPFGGGDTSLEAFAQGTPVVTMPTPYLRGNFTHAMYRAMGIDACVANSPEQYVEIALRLANDPAWREEVQQSILAKNQVLFENPAGVDELADFISGVTA